MILASEDIAPSIPPLSPDSSVLPVVLYSPVDYLLVSFTNPLPAASGLVKLTNYLSKFWRDSYNSPRTDEKER